MQVTPSFPRNTLERPLLGLLEPSYNDLLLFFASDQKEFQVLIRLEAKSFYLFPKFKFRLKDQSCLLRYYLYNVSLSQRLKKVAAEYVCAVDSTSRTQSLTHCTNATNEGVNDLKTFLNNF